MKKRSFLKRFVLLLATAAALLFAMGVEVNCNGQQTQHTHTCLTSVSGSIKSLQHVDSEQPHDIVAEMQTWQTDRTADAPFVQEYVITYDYTLAEGETITLGQNVYVSICTYSADLNFTESQIVLSKDENGVVNSGFITHECIYHGCFAAMDAAMKLTECQVKIGYYYALQQGNTSFVLPAGCYAMAEYFDFSSYVANGQVTFEDPENTSVCFNNLITSLTDPEVLALKNRGVTVYVECIEDEPAPASHTCAYTQGVDPYPLTQSTFDAIVEEMKASPAPASDEDPLQNFFYVFLTEDIASDDALTVPDGMYYGICKNGFAFDVPNLENVYVFDCEPHVCLYTNLTEVIPLWQAGLDLRFAHATALGLDFVLPDGAYALMEDVDFTAFPNLLSTTGSYAICQNGHTATGLILPAENENSAIWDCTQSVEEEGLLTHSCTEINNHITPLYITEELLAGIIDENGAFRLPDGATELALALPMSFDEVGGPMVIPKGVKMYFCLNGFTLSGSKGLAQNEDYPYIFKVEYGAELHICDCSAEKTGALISATLDMMTSQEEGEASLNAYASPIYNLGVTELNGVTLQGLTGFYNAGHLIANDSTITGVYMGVLTNEADAYEDPLHTVKPSTITNNCTINGVFSGVMKLGGDVVLQDTTVNATAFAIMSDIDLLNMNAESYNGPMVLDNVTVNLTTVIPEANESVLGLIRSFGMVTAVMVNSPIEIEGDLSVNVEEWLLAPYINDDNELKEMLVAEFIIGENTYLDIAEGVTLTDDYRVYTTSALKGELVLSNQNLSESFILMEGLVGMVNDLGEYVVLDPSACGFANNAVVTDVSVGFDGYVSLNLYCEFDSVATEESFLGNENSKVIFNIAGETVKLHPSEMEALGERSYVYSVNFFPKDYQDKIYAQFTNGKYTWTGAMSISVADFLENALLGLETAINDANTVLNDSASTETDIATAEANKKELMAYHNVVLSMLNYCGATTKYFYEAEYELLNNVFTQQEVQVTVDETTQETLEQTVWVETSVTDAMAAVTADTLKEYAPQIKEGSVLPSNVQFIGASLILNSGTFIRFYFTATEDVLQGLTVTVNGTAVSPTLYNKRDNIYYVQVENLSVLQLKTMYEMVITDGENECTVSYGALSYMYGVLNNPQASEALVLIAKAAWLYANETEKTMQILSGTETEDGEEVEINGET